MTIYEPQLVQIYILDYYKELLGTRGDRIVALNADLWTDSNNLSLDMKSDLKQPISLRGPDGMSFLLYQ